MAVEDEVGWRDERRQHETTGMTTAGDDDDIMPAP